MKSSILAFIMSVALTAICLCQSMQAFAQDEKKYIVVSGAIKDKESHEIIPFASLSVPNSNIGTVANSEGEFTIKIPNELNASQIEISHIGYLNATFNIDQKSKVYYMTPHILSLQEVIIRPETPDMLVKAAIGNISKNYPQHPAMMKAFYRETIKQRRDYLSISEAVVDVYKQSYSAVGADRTRLFKGRKGENAKKADTLLVKLQGGPTVELLIDIIKNPEELLEYDVLDNYKYEITGITKINDRPNYVISFTPAQKMAYPLYIGKFYIDQESLALTTAEFGVDLTDKEKAASVFVKKKPAGLVMTPLLTQFYVSYKQQPDGRYYINHIRSEMKFKVDWSRRWFNSNYTITSEMAITDITDTDVVKITAKESFKPNMILNDRIHDLQDDDFWGENNIIEPEQNIQNAIKKIAKHMSKQ